MASKLALMQTVTADKNYFSEVGHTADSHSVYLTAHAVLEKTRKEVHASSRIRI
jgi:hypothetical protein